MATHEMTATYERKFSDGNYGSEGMSFTMTVRADEDYFAEDNFSMTVLALREAVLTALSKSEAPQVARAAKRELNPPAPPPPAQLGPPMSDEAYFDAMADARSY